jgi:hypothetical protein
VLREGPCGELAPIAPAYQRPPSGGGAGTPFCPSRGAARPPPPPDCHVRGLSEVWVGSVLREGPCCELAPIAPAYHRPRSGGGAGTPFCPIRGAARPPRPADCHVRGLSEAWVGSVLREGPCGELAPIAPGGQAAGPSFSQQLRRRLRGIHATGQVLTLLYHSVSEALRALGELG